MEVGMEVWVRNPWFSNHKIDELWTASKVLRKVSGKSFE